MCDSKELLVGFLYGELDAPARRTFEAHLETCAECRDELSELRVTRGQIALWTPPEADLGFRIVGGPVAAPPPAPRFRIPPAWGLAAAALLVMAIGAAIANVEVRYGTGGLVVRTGWQHATDATVAAQGGDGAGVTTVDWKTRTEQLDRRLRDLEAAISSRSQTGPVQSASVSGMSDAEVLQRVREMLGQSETRQQRLLAARVAEITSDFDARRRVDLAAVDQGMARLQNSSGAEVRQYRDLIQRMYRATAYQQTKSDER
ncbi:MAG: zf-HC2 domain-containing protein [Acidobacteriota bacterium]